MWVSILLHKEGVNLEESVFRSGWSSTWGSVTSLPTEGPDDSTYGPTATVFLP